MHGIADSAARDAATRYIEEGWRIVPIPAGEKNPALPGWPETEHALDSVTGNVGVILGPVSKHLADVDLDSHFALALAPYFLPATATFGRAAKPRSHWLYYCEGLRSQRFTFERAGKVELVELRGQNASNDRCGHQSVFPGSTHATGESVEWDADGADEIAVVDRGVLIWATTRLATACAIADGWEPGTNRNNKARAWAAGLLQASWTEAEVVELFAAVFDVVGVEPDQHTKDTDAIRRTVEAFERGDTLTGFGTLAREGLVPEKVVRRVERLCRTPDTLAREAKIARSLVGEDIKLRLVREAQNTDALANLQDSTALLSGSPAGSPGVGSESFFGRSLNMQEKTKRVEYVCESLGIAPGKITVVAGYSGTSKGPFLNQLALCIASGKPFLGKPVAKRKVVFFDFETGSTLLSQRLWRMNNALGIDRAALEPHFDVFSSSRRIDDEWLVKFDEAVEPGMVCFIDSYTSAVTGNMNESEFAAVAWALGRISEERNVTIIVAMHSRKKQQGSGGTLLESIAGHASLSAAAQTAILIDRPKEDQPHLIRVKCARAVEEPFSTFEIEWADVPEFLGNEHPTTPGERAMHGKWGLIAKRVEKEVAAAKVAKAVVCDIVEMERDVLARMSAEYPGSLHALVSEITRSGRSDTRPLRRVAVRNLVERGVLLANFHWRDATRGQRQMVWLPGPKAEAGFAQN